MIDNPFVFVAGCILLIVALLRLAHSIQTRRARQAEMKAFDDAEAERAALLPQRDYSTATCPICGKYDASKPFITYAIECHRKDCAL